MFKVISKNLLLMIPTLLGIVIISFSFIRVIPGDPVIALSGERAMTPERYDELMHEFGLDLPLHEQFFSYLGDVVSGDFGKSIATRRPVVEEFFTLFPATVELSLCALFLAIVIGIPVGMVSALKKGKLVDNLLMGVSLIGYSMPIFWWGLLMIVFFSGYLGWLPVSGRISTQFFIEAKTGFLLIDSLLSGEEGAFLSTIRHLTLPGIVLSTIPLVVIARQTRSAMVEILDEDYIRTAYAKGLSKFRVVGIHALRNALIIVITVIGLQIGILLAGAILTESIFSWPGIGKWMVDSIYRRDYPAVQGGLLFISLIVMTINFIVDFTYALINPKLRK
ncbi:MAG: ABC transporter permease subunit [SAR324 cluster bacterium]|nr:ABC transporter permease subunit [SAR324 cluster bacterium]